MEALALTWGDLAFALGLVLLVVVPVIKLNVNISKLTDKLVVLSEDLDQLTAQNAKTHGRIFDTLDKHTGQINDHEKRISIIEHEKKGA
jgi:hypothetical protein